MSTDAMTPTRIAAGDRPELPADARPSLMRLTRVELRKLLDTRSGCWLSFGVAIFTVFVAVVTVTQRHPVASYGSVFQNAAQPAALFLPVVGILLIAGEFSQRTTLITFTLTPRRGRVVAAKLLACLVVCTAAWALTVACTYACTRVLWHHAGGPGPFLSAALIAQGWLLLCAEMVIGFALGLAIQLPAPAIVAFLLAPWIANIVGSSANSTAWIERWIDPYHTLLNLTAHAQSATELKHVVVTIVVWAAAPLAFGLVRLWHTDL